MVRSICLPALASMVAASETWVDETSLMQGMKPQGLHKRDTKSVSNLMETAKTMLKNGATPDVVTFASATLDEIIQDVTPAILDARNTDQDLLDSYFSRFGEALDDLATGNEDVYALNLEVAALSVQHKECRDQEAVKCGSKTECDDGLWELWLDFVDEETALREIQRRIKGHFCAADANGTLAIFRQDAVGPLHQFIDYMEWYRSDYWFDQMRPVCVTHFENLDTQTALCDSIQTRLESASCQHAIKVREVRGEFARAWQDALDVYLPAVDYVYSMWFDRVQEVKTLAVVRCLLDRTTARNGRECDETTGEAETEVTTCETRRETEDITPYEHVYHEIPLCPDVCANRHHVSGQCIPEPPVFPCSAGYLAQEYSQLPAIPEAEFHYENSHCNPRPICQACAEMQQPENIGTICPACASCTRMEIPGSPAPDMSLQTDLVTGNNAGIAAFTGQHWRTCAAEPFTCSGTPPPPTVTTTTTVVPSENCPNPYGNFRVCSAWGDPHYSHVFYRDAAAGQAAHEHGRRGNAFGTMMQHHQVGVFDLARSNDGSFAAQAFFCHSDMARATTSVNGLIVSMNGQRTSFIRGSQTGPKSDPRNPAVGGSGDDIYGWITSSSGFPKDATDITVNGEPIDWDTLGDGVNGGTMRGRGTHVSDLQHQGRDFQSASGAIWMQQLKPVDRASRSMAPVCLGDRARTKTVAWSLPQFNRVYEPIISIYMEDNTIAEEGLCGSEAATGLPPMLKTDSKYMFEESEISQICNVCGLVEGTHGCELPVDFTPPENVRQICEFNEVDHDVAQAACDQIAGAAAWLEACIQEYCAEGGLNADQILAFVAQMERAQEGISEEEEGGAAVQILIGRSTVNSRCVTVSTLALDCDISAGHPGVRVNMDYVNAPDTFHVSVVGNQVCARRTDGNAGWGMQLEIQCQLPSPPEVEYIFIDSSSENTKCVDTASQVHCNAFAGDLGERINDHPAGDRFDITTTETQVCARRLDFAGGWGMRLHLLCHVGPAPVDLHAPGTLVPVLVDRSSSENRKCVTTELPLVCAADAGDLHSRLNDHPAADTFTITVDGLEVCAQRTDSAGGWGMRLNIPCHVAGTSDSTGYTADGCVGSDEVSGEHPVTLQSDAQYLADVRCCSLEGNSCSSENLPRGEQYFHLGNLHSSGCVEDVTFSEAQDICTLASMRLCNVDEVQACCSTGCYHDHHAIWVTNNPVVAQD